MFACLFALLLTPQVLPPSPEPFIREAQLRRQLDDLDGNITELRGYLQTKFRNDTLQPQMGLIVFSPTDRGSAGIHHVTVLSVYPNSPADLAGIRPGERIASIDGRVLEHEPTVVVNALLHSGTGPLKLVVERRNGKGRRTLTVQRIPLPCLQEAIAAMELEVWQTRLSSMESLVKVIRTQLDASYGNELALDAVQMQLARTAQLFADLGDPLQFAILKATRDHCHPKYE